MDEKRRGFKLGRAIRLSVYLARRVFEREETFVFESDETVGREGNVRDVFVESERDVQRRRFDRGWRIRGYDGCKHRKRWPSYGNYR